MYFISQGTNQFSVPDKIFNNDDKLSLIYKLLFPNPYIFATQFQRPLILKLRIISYQVASHFEISTVYTIRLQRYRDKK